MSEKSNYEKLAAIDVSSISYNPDTGIVVWKNCKKSSLNGTKLGTFDKDGYLTAKINQVRVRLHRLIWRIYYEEWPSDQIDHINGIKHDNRIENLRIANNSQNNCNKPVSKRNKLGIKGIRKHGNKYQALICKNKTQILIGSFDSINAAINAYYDASKILHGEFCYAGI